MRISFILVAVAFYSAIVLGGCNVVYASGPKTASVSSDVSISSESAKLNEVFKQLIDPGALEVGDSLISPSSSLYFLKAIREKIEIYFSATEQIRTQHELEFSVRRLREVRTLIEEGREDLIEETLSKYWEHLNLVEKQSNGKYGIRGEIGASIARHMYVLQSLYYNTNEETAKRAIRASVQKVLDHNWKLLTGADLGLDERENLSDKIAIRQIAGCQFLNEESNNTSISEAERSILKEYVEGCQKHIKTYFQDQLKKL